jgi:hypothetical protein
MGLFSKKITTDQIAEALAKLFEEHHERVINGIKKYSNKVKITSKDNKGILVSSMLGTMEAISQVFGDSEIGKDLFNKFEYNIHKRFKTKKEKEQFQKIFKIKFKEYLEMDPNCENYAMRFGNIFCEDLIKNKDVNPIIIMAFITQMFISSIDPIKHLLNEYSSKFKIV